MLASVLHNRSLSLKDERFVDDLLTDLCDYLHRNDSYRVLLFPPLNGYKRLLIHKTVESEFSDLVTFSVGTGTSRRTVVAFKIACSRGPSGIQLMSNPGSPTPKGRGRGRWKEMSSNERVANWVNQREAKRLNKERWTNHVTGTHSSLGDGGDVLVPTKHEGVELESSLDRSRAKRQNVPLYVPPSLRAKKESGTKKDPSEINVDCFGGKGPESDDKAQNEGMVTNSAVGGGCEDQQPMPRETSRSKGRGRGRKKPEAEIYVPRALRAAKHDSSKCVPGTEVFGEHRSLCTEEIQYKAWSADSNISISTIALPSQSFIQSPEFSDALHSDDVSYDEIQHCSSGELVDHYHANDSHSPFSHDLVTKKVKYDSSSSSAHQNESDMPVSSPLTHATSDGQPHVESAGNSLTFEFYDPAVVAFLPSSCCVLNSSDINISYSMGDARETQTEPQVPASLQQNVTVFSDSSISSDSHAQILCTNNEYQSQVSIEKDVQQSLVGVCEGTKKDSQQGRIDQIDTCINRSFPSFSSEQISTNDVMESQNDNESSEKATVSEVDDCDKLVLIVDNAGDLASNAHVEMFEDLHAVSGSAEEAGVDFSERTLTVTHLIQEAYPSDSMFEKDMSVPLQQTVQTEIDQSEGQAYDSEQHENGNTEVYEASSHLVDDEGDSWDALFDDNGDCLDDTVVKELTEYVGKVEIDKPKINYLNYEPKEAEMDHEAFSHILEIYDFSPDLATCDLITAFREFSSRGFDVKWVDDTHALGIFSGAIAAKEALKMMHPLLKVRPLSEASRKGQSKARHCQEFLQPYKARPETTSIAARRLVAGALGMMPQVSKEVRELERKKLKEAKERRRQERQQKIDIWDGSFRKCAMDEENTDSR